MAIRHEIHLIGGDEPEQAFFTEYEVGDECRLLCAYRGKTIERSASDFFEALRLVRQQLEAENLIPVCYGASQNVYPSPMARAMDVARRAYQLTLGAQTRTGDLVDIFDVGPDIVPAYVDAQDRFYDNWLASLGR